MRGKCGIVAVVVALFATCTKAYIFNAHAHPSLDSIAKVTPGTVFRSRLDFSFKDGRGKTHELAIKGPVFELLNDATRSIPLPNADGIQPRLSTGSKAVKVKEDAFFVGMQGMQIVPFEKGCWELAWISDEREGRLVCAFYLPIPIRRSNAWITNGDTYFSFSVYTHESLVAAQEMKRRIHEKNAEAMFEKEMHLEKMHSTTNVFMKAFHYRNAFAAFEKVLYAPMVSSIPDHADVMELPNGLLVVQQGSIYRKGNGLIGPSWYKMGIVSIWEDRTASEDLEKLKP